MDFETLLNRYKETRTAEPVAPVVDGRKKITAKQLMDMIAERQAKKEPEAPPPPPIERPPTPPAPDLASVLFGGIRDAQRATASILEATPPPPEAPPIPPAIVRPVDQTDIETHTAMFDDAPHEAGDMSAVVSSIREQVRTEETQRYMSRIEIEEKVKSCERICKEMEDTVRQVKKRLYQIDLHFSYIRQIMAVDDEELQIYVDDMSSNNKNIDEFYSGLDRIEPKTTITIEEEKPATPPPPELQEEEIVNVVDEEEEQREERFVIDDRVSQLKNTFLFRPVPPAPPSIGRPGIMASSHDARFFSRFM